MKKSNFKSILFLLLFFIFISYLSAEELFVGSVSYLDIDSTTEESFNVKYDTEEDLYYLQTSDWITVGWVILTPEQFKTLQATVDKALDWCTIAKDNQSSIKKEIPNSNINCSVLWQYGDDPYINNPYDKLSITFQFFSIENDVNQILSSLVLTAPKITASSNEFVDYKFPHMLIPEDFLQEFATIITDSNISSVVEKYNKAKAAEDLFN